MTPFIASVIVALVFTAFGIVIGWLAAREGYLTQGLYEAEDNVSDMQLEVQDVLENQLRHLDMAQATHEAMETLIVAITAVEKSLTRLCEIADRNMAKGTADSIDQMIN